MLRTVLTLAATIALITVRAHAAGISGQTTAAQPRAVTLDEAVRMAESQSEAIRIARAGVQRAEGQQYQARAQRLPQINGSASYTRTLTPTLSNVGRPRAVDTHDQRGADRTGGGPCPRKLTDRLGK